MCILESPQPRDCRRHAEREPVVLAGSAYGLARSRSVVISDLSSEGAQLDGRDLPPPGEDLVVVVGAADTFARVVWRTADKAGVHFDGPLPAETIARIKKDAAWETVAGWWR